MYNVVQQRWALYNEGVKTVNSHLRVLVAQKELRERRKLPIRTIASETGAARSAVERMLNNTIREVPLDALTRLCIWLPADVGEILRLEDVPDDMPAPAPEAAPKKRRARNGGAA